MSERAKTIDTLLDERRTFAPSAEFLSKARVTDQSLFKAAEADPEAFWAEQARKYVSWYKPFDTVLEWELPFAKWFVGGQLNVSYNCLDRHVEAGRGENVAYHFAGDGARIDEDGYFWFMGRVDDVMNFAGHRISTAEVESALVDHPAVAEAAVVAKSDPETGQAISAFVTLRSGYEESTELIVVLRDHVAKLIGPIAKPKWIAFTPDLPKTRSGKIMRRLLRDIAENRKLGDTTTLADSSIVADLQRRATEEEAKEQ